MSEGEGSLSITAVMRLVRTRRRLVQDTGREPTIGELAAEMHVPHDDVRRLLEVASGDMTFRPTDHPDKT